MSLSSSAPLHPLQKRNPTASMASVLGCICLLLLLLPLVAGVKETEIDLKTANHGFSQDHAAKDSHSAETKKLHKVHPKKYIDDHKDDFYHENEEISIYDKKYFDYLPAERKRPMKPTADSGLIKRTNSRRLRRDTKDAVEQPRVKRQGWNTYHIPAFQGYPTIVQPGNIMYDPYHRPMLHNHYLPPQPVRPIPSPTNTNQIPDRTYLPANAPRPQPADQPGTFDFGNRLGENVFAFDIVYDPNVDTNYILHRGPRPTYSFQGLPASRPTSATMRPLPPATMRPLPPVTTPSDSSSITTTTPRPVIQNNSDDDFDWASLGLSPDAAVGTRLGGDTGNNNDNSSNPNRRAAPSKCTWAIANCCSQFSDKIRYHCFEQNQCFGAFWGDNVCRTYYKLALTEIENYYNVL
ncbi:uncharacterized protein LOC5576866 isoform X3 [Aedes aegypti]|nr:uncharacterized protein LOC5576866 isoform X3 [Aedes aegypti]XP_021708405.1 uncharacterized protein LOC5576866 isoform X3 [Aedes aegypti]